MHTALHVTIVTTNVILNMNIKQFMCVSILLVNLMSKEQSQGDLYAYLPQRAARWHTFMALVTCMHVFQREVLGGTHSWSKQGVPTLVVLKEFKTSYWVYWTLSTNLSLHCPFFFFPLSRLAHSLVGLSCSPCLFSHLLIIVLHS